MTPMLALLALLQVATDPVRVTVTSPAAQVEVDATLRLEVKAYDAQGREMAVETPAFFTTSPRVVRVDPTTGEVTALAPGQAQVSAVVQGVVGFVLLEVPALPPAHLAVSGPGQAIPQGASALLEVEVHDRRGEVLLQPPLSFQSESPSIVMVDAGGRVTGLAPGEASVTIRSGDAEAQVTLQVTPNPAVSYRIVPGEVAPRTGDVVRFRLEATDASGREVEGFHPAWSVEGVGAHMEMEGPEGVFVAEEPGQYRIQAVVGPTRVESALVDVEPRGLEGRLMEVGRGPAGAGAAHHSGDTWIFEGVDGRDYALIGTFFHDWMKVWDVTEPASPVLTDSIQMDARRINDVKVHPNNRIGVATREGASDRRNGIVILDLSTPAHPTILSTYDATVSGGVHNVWITENPDLVYACHNGTSDIHIIDISDPVNPREVGRWGVESEGKSLHDIIVQDGYAYASYWDDGVIILDVGAGTHGGTPTTPVFVSSYKYPSGNTHTAWRQGDYLFVGDEVFPEDWDPYAPIEARGYVHVLDVSDIEHPREVARYEVPEAGAHNFWPEGDYLYVGYYQAGLRVLDISGELRGDLYRQGREVAVLKTTDENTMVPNWPMTWGAQPYKGNLFTSDLNSGLWIARFIREGQVVF